MTDIRVRGSFEFEASLEDVTKGWTDDERQAFLDGDEVAQDEALTALLHLASVGRADENDCTIDVRRPARFPTGEPSND